MRTLSLILIALLAGLWTYYGVAIAPLDMSPPAVLAETGEAPSAASLNNEGVRLDRQGRRADALAYFERARSFRPRDAQVAANLARQRARVARDGWHRALLLVTLAGGGLLLARFAHRAAILGRDGALLGRLRQQGEAWARISPEAQEARLALRFTEPVESLLRRHPLTIVWSSASYGKHMKSRPPVEARGQTCTVRLDGERIERLRRYPGSWRGFLYLGRVQVGEAALQVGR